MSNNVILKILILLEEWIIILDNYGILELFLFIVGDEGLDEK